MHFVKIHVRKGKTAGYTNQLLDIVHQTIVNVLKVPEHDRLQQLYEFDAWNFEIPSDKTENFVILELTIFKGRSNETKKKLYAELAKNLNAKLGIDGNDLLIIIHEPPLENWGIKGGKPANEVDLGFNVDV